MYEIILGYILGVFTVCARNLQKSGKVNFALYQWLIVALVLSFILYLMHRFINFDFAISRESFLFTFESMVLPLLALGIAIFYFIYKYRHKNKDE